MKSKKTISLTILVLASMPLGLGAQGLSNGDFSNGMSGWFFQSLESASATASVTDGVLEVQISQPGTEQWHVQLVQGSINIEEDSTYLIKFSASAEAARTINAGVGLNQDPWSQFGGTQVSLTDQMQEFQFSFVMSAASNTNSRIVFDFGSDTADVRLDNISIEKVAPAPIIGIKPSPFGKGVNLTNWFQVPSARQVDFTKYTKEDFENIKSLGADVIRLPINLHFMTDGAPNYTIDPLLFFFLDQVVDWAEELELHLILDNHTFDPIEPTDPEIGDVLIPVWTQMADHYKNRSELLYYEILNEPHGISDALWNEIQGNVIDAIRTVDETHTIIVGGSGYNGYSNLQYMPEYADTNLIYTFHFYDPFLLTHQGASWTDPSLVSLSGIPFPYDADKMPDVPEELEGTSIAASFPDYANQGTVDHIQRQLDIAVYFGETRGVRLFCGELGVYIPNSDNQSRVNWYGPVTDYLNEHGISWTSWDYQGGFGLFEAGSNELFDHDINESLVEAMGFNVPSQTEFQVKQDSGLIEIYQDFTAKGIFSGSGSSGELNFYADTAPYDGDFSIFWSGAPQYSNITFDFRPIRDLSYLEQNSYTLTLWAKGDTPGAEFDLRFIDTDTNTDGDHPWRMNLRVNDSMLPKDSEWHQLVFYLGEFQEMGSWDDEEWFVPQGDFDWSKVDVFQIVAESGAHGSAKFWFDTIQIDGSLINSTEPKGDSPFSFKLNQNYPNPFNPATTISFELEQANQTTVKIFDSLGREVTTLVDGFQSAGLHSINFDASNLASGIYFYELKSGQNIQRKSMVLIK